MVAKDFFVGVYFVGAHACGRERGDEFTVTDDSYSLSLSHLILGQILFHKASEHFSTLYQHPICLKLVIFHEKFD